MVNTFELIAIPLIAGFILDTIFGDPHKLPHPVRLFGYFITLLDNALNRGANKKNRGFIMLIVASFLTFILFLPIIKISYFNTTLYYVTTTVFVYFGIANHSLIKEVLKVEFILQKNDIVKARRQLSFIVGRDTGELSVKQIRTALLETLSENLSDGVIAPVFYYLIGGVPLMMTYKMVNTLDSMVGYKNDKYLKFGYASAKADDILNYIPSRITAFLMALLSLSPRAFAYIFKYGKAHSSPNAGYPEAALAGILNCRLGGPNRYHGKEVIKPFIGKNDREITFFDIYISTVVNFTVAVAFITLGLYALSVFDIFFNL